MMIRGGSSITWAMIRSTSLDRALREDLTGINTNDIESMQVLKDAASASIYGARASNGVILVRPRFVGKRAQIVDLRWAVRPPSQMGFHECPRIH